MWTGRMVPRISRTTGLPKAFIRTSAAFFTSASVRSISAREGCSSSNTEIRHTDQYKKCRYSLNHSGGFGVTNWAIGWKSSSLRSGGKLDFGVSGALDEGVSATFSLLQRRAFVKLFPGLALVPEHLPFLFRAPRSLFLFAEFPARLI